MNACTRIHREGQIRRFASALVHAGEDAEQLDSIAELLTRSRLRKGVDWMKERRGGKLGPGIRELVIALRHAAHWHVRVEAEELEWLDKIVRNLGAVNMEMSEKNQTRALEFRSDSAVRRLVELPDRLVAESEKRTNAHEMALLWETAVAIAILTYLPLRRVELLSIRIDLHLEPRKSSGRSVLRISLPKGSGHDQSIRPAAPIM